MKTWFDTHLESALTVLAILAIVSIALLGNQLGGPIFGITLSVLVLVVLGRDRIEKLSVGMSDGRFETVFRTLEKARALSEEARGLAALTAEAAFHLATKPSGHLDGGTWSQDDELRIAVAKRLRQLNAEKDFVSEVTESDNSFMGGRLLSLVLASVGDSDGGAGSGSQRLKHLLSECQKNKDKIATFDDVDACIPEAIRSKPEIQQTLDLYRQWHQSDPKLYFVVDQLLRITELEKRPWKNG
ncbi:hypothetical protein [Amorphus sp. MBR-141]